MCYTTWGQDGVFAPQNHLHVIVIAKASDTSIVRVTPTRVGPFVQTVFTVDAASQLHSLSSFIAFARSGACATVARVANQTHALLHNHSFTSSVSGEGDWVLCYSTNGTLGPFVQQGWQLAPTVFGITPADATQISHVAPMRITVGFETEVELSGAMFSELHSYVAFSVAGGNCSEIERASRIHTSSLHTYPLLSRTVKINVSSSDLTSLCYSTSGPHGPFVSQNTNMNLHYVENPGRVFSVMPSRIAAGMSYVCVCMSHVSYVCMYESGLLCMRVRVMSDALAHCCRRCVADGRHHGRDRRQHQHGVEAGTDFKHAHLSRCRLLAPRVCGLDANEAMFRSPVCHCSGRRKCLAGCGPALFNPVSRDLPRLLLSDGKQWLEHVVPPTS